MASAPSAPYSPAPTAPLSVHTTGATAGGFNGAAKPDVSPVSEKTPAFTAMPVARKEVSSGKGMTPPIPVSSPAPTEVSGSAVPERHEVHSESTGTSMVSGHGHGQSQGQGRWVYEVSGQGGAVELGGGEEEGRGLFR